MTDTKESQKVRCPKCHSHLGLIKHKGISHLDKWYGWCMRCQREYGYYDTRTQAVTELKRKYLGIK